MNELLRMDECFDPQMNLLRRAAKSPGYHTQLADGTMVHETRQSMDYALLCLASKDSGHVDRACRVVDAVLNLQVTDPLKPHFGIWGWFAEEPPEQMSPADWNWADFIGARIAQILVQHAEAVGQERVSRMNDALERAAMAIFRRQSPVGYTNIAIMGSVVTAAAGELLSRPILLEYGRQKLRAVLELAREIGTFSEYNSPTYTMVAIEECERALLLTRDSALRATARDLLSVAWQMVADHWHAPTKQWAGPHGRAYSDRLSAETRHRIERAIGIANKPDADGVVPSLPCPPEQARKFVEPIVEPRTVEMPLGGEVDGERKVAITWLAPTCCLSSVTREHTWTQRRQILAYWPADDDVAMFKVQFLMDGREMPGMRLGTSQYQNRILLAAYPLHNCGAWHPQFHIPPRTEYEMSDLRFRFGLNAPGASVRQLSPTRFELTAADHRVVIDTVDGDFDGAPIRWSPVSGTDQVSLDAICVEKSKRVCFETLRLRFAAAIQLIAPGLKWIESPVVLTDAGENRLATWEGSGTGPVTVPMVAKAFSW